MIRPGSVTSRRRAAASETGRRPGPATREEGGYIAVTTGLLLIVFIGLCAFSVDLGRWYFVAMQEQKAADAGALAGVVALPGDPTSAHANARTYTTANGFTHGGTTTVTSALAGGPTRLRVDVSRTVDNIFGPLLGVPRTTVSRYAIAEYQGPVPLGSPCNRFGEDPDRGSTASANCNGTGDYWGMVGSPQATKVNGDAFQNDTCSSEDGCSGGTNRDYDPEGYVYLVTLRQAVSNLTIEAFDPAQVVVGATCANNSTNRLAAAAALPSPAAAVVTNPSARYAPGAGDWCTGDSVINDDQATGGLVRTEFIVRAPGANPWEPTGWPQQTGCRQTFQPFNGDLSRVLDKRTAQYAARPDVAANFRRWVQLCRVNGVVPAGTYAVQVQTNGLGADSEGGHNRFALRAYGTGGSDKDTISIAGFSKMALFANTPSGTSSFFLAKVPSSAKGQTFNVNLFDIGDGASGGSYVRVKPPTETGSTFSGCQGSGRFSGALSSCQVAVNSGFDGKWQTISVPIPPTYSCTDASPTGCWLRLEFFYGSGSDPTDTTSWSASLEGDPIRLVE